jgi:GNAT superfamily N-acetyltransferase
VNLREATRDDADFLADMLVEAVNWSPEWKRKSKRRVLAAPNTAHYVAGWPRDGDLGVVAEADGERVGAAWLRFFTVDDLGHGFVAVDVPELSLGVVATWRGRGVGRALVRAVESRARTAGVERISLSVERKNFAQRLYLAEGYEVVAEGSPDSDTMVKVLGRE